MSRDETRRPPHPTQPGPVAEGHLELNRELTQRSPDASREQVEQAQEALQRARPEAVGEAAAGRPLAGSAAEAEGAQGRPHGTLEAPGAVRSPFADAATTTRDPAGEAG